MLVFAVEDDAVQVTWPALPAPEVVIEVGDRRAEVTATPPAFLRRLGRPPRPLTTGSERGGPGACALRGLAPATTYDVTVSGPGLPRRRVARVATLRSPPGPQLSRFATISDLHLGESHFGALGTIVDRAALGPGEEPFPLRCARAAVDEALAWGAQLLVVKGDLTHCSAPSEFLAAGRLLASVPVPVLAVLGNHDVRGRANGAALLAGHGVEVATSVATQDVAGVRLVLVHTPDPRHRGGEIDAKQRAAVAEAVGGAPGGAFVAMHHQPVGRAYPPGVVGGDAGPFLDALVAANPATMLSAGHTHRHRRRRYGPMVLTEVGSTKDFPGTWAGYAVHQGGIRQVVRRVAAPAAMAWTESTGAALGGLWAPWAAGIRSQRCFSHRWPTRR